ncbi:MAG TPA: dipeptidase, partial [Acidobacteriota bacterium]|nr:dipeptidase [Acidobacteriota bacterium]
MQRTVFFAFFLATTLVGSASGDDAEARAAQILKKIPLIDGHNDVPWVLQDKHHRSWDRINFMDTTTLPEPMHTDIPRLRRGGVGAQFWSVYVPVEVKSAAAVQAVWEQINIVRKMVHRYPDVFEFAYTADDILRIHKKGKIGSLIGVEGGHCINNSLAVLRELYASGARYMTLTHSENTDWADSATAAPAHDGLTDFGKKVVQEMNWLGMLVDISHVSPKTMKDTLQVTQAPVIFSHSSARALSNHPRNVPDDVLKLVSANGGVVMVNFATSFVSEKARLYSAEEKGEESRLTRLYPEDPERVKKELEEWKSSNPNPRATLQQVADHIDHIRKIAGIDSIGIGSDFDGIPY